MIYGVSAFDSGLRVGAFLAAFALVGTAGGQAQAAKSDGAGAYATGKYRNLFEEDGHSQKEIQAKIDAAYQQLFHGDPQTQAIAFAAGSNANGPLMYVTDWANHDVRTEGMSYGMMITVELNKKAEFDAIVVNTPIITDKDKNGLSLAAWTADRRSNEFLYSALGDK